MTQPADLRHLPAGTEIPSEHYCDQPYVVRCPDGTWVCVMTTGRGVEGEQGQHVVSIRSSDHGRTWSEPVDIEPADGPEASWVMPVITPSGRIYAVYTYNTRNLREVVTTSGTTPRVDTLGDVMMKCSDDGGRSWSAERWPVPVRELQIDRDNPYGGAVRLFWQVGKPIADHGRVYFGLHKVGRFGYGFMETSEGVILRSDNLLTEPDPARVTWETLPDGDVGLRAPQGPVADEHNVAALSDGSLFCVWRTIDGHPAHAYSRDGGHTWTPPAYLSHTPGGRPIKHPRAANFVKKTGDGRFLYWFHNHGGQWYDDRNPVWVLGGLEREGLIHWSQPEILLYDDDPRVRISYPDFIEEDGRYWYTETQKTIARVHEIDPALLHGLWEPPTTVAREGLVAEAAGPGEIEIGKLPSFEQRQGVSVDLWLKLDGLGAGQVLASNRGADGQGFELATTADATVALTLNDGRTENAWACDRGMITPGAWHHLAAIADGGPKVISFVVDGVFCDGADQRQFGWGRFSPHLREVNGGPLRVGEGVRGELGPVRVYGRALRTAEAVGNWRAGR